MKRYGLFDDNIKEIFNLIENSFNNNYVLIGGVSRVALSSIFFEKHIKDNHYERLLTDIIIKGFSDIDLLFYGDSEKIKKYLEKNKFNFTYDPWENELVILINNNKYLVELINIDLLKEDKIKAYYKGCIERALKFNIKDISTKILSLEDFILTKMFIKFKEEKDRETKDLEDVKNLLLYIKSCGKVNLDLNYIYSCLIYSRKTKEEINKNLEILNLFML